MADAKKILGGLGKVGKRLVETPEQARLRELMSHSGDNVLPLKLPRANLSDEFINAQADRVARQMLGEHVTSGKAGETKNLAGRSMKESERVKGLNYTLKPTGTVAKETPYVPRKGDVKVAFPGDQTVSDKILVDVNGFPIDSHQQGGAYYGLGQKHLPEPEFWKSTETSAKNVQGKVNRLAELYEPERIIGSHLAMGPTSNNFAMHLADANLKAVDWTKVHPDALKSFDDIISGGYKDPKTGELVTFPNWPGLADRQGALAAMKEDSNLRKWFTNRMKTPSVTQPRGLPNGLDIQYAITEPRIRDMEINMTGLMTGELKPNALVEAAGAPHNTYSHRILGEAYGPEEVLSPFVIGFPDAATHIASTKRPSDFTGTIQKVFPHQVVDDQYINQYNQYRERIKKLTGKKKGGTVDISEADKRLAKAIENRMAKGGAVDLEAADARLSAAIDARMGMADGGKVAKGAAKVFKKLFADAPKADALKLAQERAALPVSQGGLGLPKNNTAEQRAKAMGFDRDTYHGSFRDIKKFDPSVGSTESHAGKGIYSTDSAEDASRNYANIYGPDVSNRVERGMDMRDKDWRKTHRRMKDETLTPRQQDILLRNTVGTDNLGVVYPLRVRSDKSIHLDAPESNPVRIGPFEHYDEASETYVDTPHTPKFNEALDEFRELGGDANPVYETVQDYGGSIPARDVFNAVKKTGNESGLYDPFTGDIVSGGVAAGDFMKHFGIDEIRHTPRFNSQELNIGKEHTISFDPDNVRSRFAAFDPFRRSAATAAAMGVAAPDLLAKEKGKDKKKAHGGLTHMADGGKLVKGAGKVMKRLLSSDDEPYSEISGMVSKMGEEGRLPIIPVPNRWFMQPDKFPNQQKLIERVLQQTGKSREDFMSGAFIDPRTGEILDSRIMDDLGVVIDPKTNRPMMSAKGESGLEQMNPKTGSYTKSNLVRKGLFKPEGGDPLLNDLNFLATIEKGDVGHKYGLATEYASPTELFNTGTGANPTLRPRSRGDLFGIGDVIGQVRVGRSEPHDVYEKLFVAPKGSDVQGKKLSKANGGLAHMGKGGKMAALGKLGKRLLADPDAVTPSVSGGTRKFGNDANGLNIIKETGGNWSPSGELVYQSQLDRELDKLKKGRFDTPINVLRYHMEQDALAGNTARKAQMEQALAQALKTEAANKWIDSNLRNYVTKQMASKDDPVRKLADEGIKAFPVNVDEFDEPQLRTYGSYNAKMKREKAGLPKEGVAKSPLAKHYETLADEAINPVDAKHYQRIQDLPRIQRPAYTMDMPWVNKLDPETPIYSLDKDADLNKLGFDHIMDVLREDLAAGRIRPEQMNKISMEQAVRRTHEYDEALKAKMLNARIAEQANANVFKEYPEGYKWVQLDKPGQFNLESDIMGHSVRGYEPPQGHPDWADISGNSGYKDYGHGGYEAIKSGDAKVYSLRDPKGMSHVTVEVGPNDHLDYNDWFKKQPEEIQNKIAKRRLDDKNHDIYSGPEYLADRGKILPKITQIKGKQNAAPNEDYLEFVQDFVKSGNWSDVGDFANTGLVRIYPESELAQTLSKKGLPVPKYASQQEVSELLKQAEVGSYRDASKGKTWINDEHPDYKTDTPPTEGMAEGGGAFKKLQFMGGGGITTTAGTFSPEDLGVEASDLGISDKRMNQIKRNAADLWGEGKEQLEKEYKQLGRKGGKKDFALRVGSQFLGGGSDLVNLGLEGIDLIQGAIPALSKPESVMDVAGTGDRVPKFRLASDKPWLGSQQFIDKFKEAKLLGENEFPLTELVAGFAAPAAAVGALNKGKQAYKGAKTLVNTPKKRRGGLTAMAR